MCVYVCVAVRSSLPCAPILYRCPPGGGGGPLPPKPRAHGWGNDDRARATELGPSTDTTVRKRGSNAAKPDEAKECTRIAYKYV